MRPRLDFLVVSRLVQTQQLGRKTRAHLEGRGPQQTLEQIPDFRFLFLGPTTAAAPVRRQQANRWARFAAALRNWFFGRRSRPFFSKVRKRHTGDPRPGYTFASPEPVRNVAAGVTVVLGVLVLGQFLFM